MKYVYFLIGTLFFSFQVNATVYRTITDGDWTNDSIWENNVSPGYGIGVADTVIIEHRVEFGNKMIEIAGLLNTKPNSYLFTSAPKGFTILAGGTLIVEDTVSVEKIKNDGNFINSGYIGVGDFNNDSTFTNYGWVLMLKTFYNKGYVYNYDTIWSPGKFGNNGGYLTGDSGMVFVDGNYVDNSDGVITCNGPGRITICTSWWAYPGSVISSSGSVDTCIRFCGGAALPVELTHFDAKWERNSAVLNWETATETNHSHFEIQKSYDGINWNKIANKFSDSPNSTVVKYYEYQDFNAYTTEAKVAYYRLVQVDVDGTYEILPVKALDIEQNVEVNVNIYPVPAIDMVNFEIKNPNIDKMTCQIEIYTTFGQLVWEKKIRVNTYLEYKLDLSEFAAGAYFVNINTGKEIIEKRLIVMNESLMQ